MLYNLLHQFILLITKKIIMLILVLFIGYHKSSGQYIHVKNDFTPIQLVKDIFLGSSCIDIDEESIRLTGYNSDNTISYVFFEKGKSNFPLESGILLTTGNLNAAVGPNTTLQSFTNSDWKGDKDLEEALNLTTNTTYNATILSFDFTSIGNDQIIFEYIFASEQYLRRSNEGNCGYTDGFAFLIKEYNSPNDYLNIALIPGTNIPVSVNTIFGTGGLCTPVNPQYFSQFNFNNSPTNFNGETVILNAIANVTPGKKYTIKLVIADQGNGLYDSGVFLKAGSFSNSINLGKDLTITEGTALCEDETYQLNAYQENAINYKWFRNGQQIASPNASTYLVHQPGKYYVEIELATSCIIKGSIIIEYHSSPIIKNTSFYICDEDLDNKINIHLPQYNNQILEGYNNTINIQYFNTYLEAQQNINSIEYLELLVTDLSKNIYVRLQNQNCLPIIEPLFFILQELSTSNSVNPFIICDENMDGSEYIDLTNYTSFILHENPESLKFFASENDAKLNKNEISEQQILTQNSTFFIRYSYLNKCENIAILNFHFKTIKKSEVLKDQTICQNSTTSLDAGEGYDSYFWFHSGETTSKIENVPIGVYQVRLELEGCFYIQEVVVSESENPIIENILIRGNTVTINVTNANNNFLYALDNGPFQSSNVFYNVTVGKHTIHVKSSTECTIISQEFSIIEILNFISPNQDGINDFLNFSQLKEKNNPIFKIYNRLGEIIFEGSLFNNFIWDGTFRGKKVSSGTYWYTIEWKEIGSEEIISQRHWILLKRK